MERIKQLIKPRFEENIIETLDIREMVGKYLAEDVYKTWTEDLVDRSTGEILSIENKELLFRKGISIDLDLASKIQFSIQAEEITKPVKVTDVHRKSEMWKTNHFRPIMVHISTGLAKPWILLWADDFVHAMEIVKDYMEQLITDGFTIFEVKNLGAMLVDREEFYEKQEEQAEKLNLELNPLRYYSIDAIWKESGTPYPFVNPSKEAKENLRYGTFVVMAESLDEAKKLVSPEISRLAIEEDRWKSIEIHWEKGKPFSPSIIIPKSFCESYQEYYKGKE